LAEVTSRHLDAGDGWTICGITTALVDSKPLAKVQAGDQATIRPCCLAALERLLKGA
jgi:hypothetical protein